MTNAARLRSLIVSALGLALLAVLPALASEDDAHDPGLAGYMSSMQRYLHKLDLSVQAGNAKLAGYYIHEIEETAEEIAENIASYDGHPVGQLTSDKLPPAIEALEDALAKGDGAEAMDGLVSACNACHVVTDHAYIKIRRAGSNPFNQDFSP